MLNEGDFLLWCRRLALAETTQAAIAEVRSRNPTRRVGGGRENVSGRYPSRKMGLTIQFESHRVELPLVYEMEHDPGVLEYYDQPPSIPLAYHAANGRRVFGHAHTGLLRNPPRLCGVGGMQILRGSSKTGHQELQTATVAMAAANGAARPARRTARPLGLDYRVWSSAEINWILQRNLTVPGRLSPM